ncbi:fungal-specific transcription factor domain-containing protein [Aspergillus varians]
MATYLPPKRQSRVSSQWSRTGCMTCKARRKKCDRARPTCTACEKRGLQCEGYQDLFVQQDVHRSGVTQKRVRAVSRGAPYDSSSSSTSAAAALASSPNATTAGGSFFVDGSHLGVKAARRNATSASSTTFPTLAWINLVSTQPALDQGSSSRSPENGPFLLSGGSSSSSSSSSSTQPDTAVTEGLKKSESESESGPSPRDESEQHTVSGIQIPQTTGGSDGGDSLFHLQTDETPCLTSETFCPVDITNYMPEMTEQEYSESPTEELFGSTPVGFADGYIEYSPSRAAIDAATTAILPPGPGPTNAPAGGGDHLFAPGIPPLFNLFPDFTEQESYYLQYLDEQAAQQLLNVDAGMFNPLRRLILPRATAYAGILNGICAVAACHRAQRSDPDTRLRLSAIANGFYLKSVNWLRSSFGGEANSPSLPGLDDNSVLTALLLCKYEIVKGSATHWRGHLGGLELLLQKRGGIGSLEAECGHLRYHRMVADICHCEKSTPSRDETDLDMIASSSLSLNVYSGCAHHLLRACHNIARAIGRLESHNLMSFPEFYSQTEEIVLSLGTSIIDPGIQVCSGNMEVSQISRLLYVAQRTRYAAFVFLHALVDRAIETCRFTESESLDLRSQIPYTKAQALDGCLEMLAHVPIGEHCEFAGLALSLFLAGCEVREPHWKYLILEKLFTIERSFGLGHISRGREALMLIWQRGRRKAWWNVMREEGLEIILC